MLALVWAAMRLEPRLFGVPPAEPTSVPEPVTISIDDR
jgi:hypothetical protein